MQCEIFQFRVRPPAFSGFPNGLSPNAASDRKKWWMRFTATGSYRNRTCFPGWKYYNTVDSGFQFLENAKKLDSRVVKWYPVPQGISAKLKWKRSVLCVTVSATPTVCVVVGPWPMLWPLVVAPGWNDDACFFFWDDVRFHLCKDMTRSGKPLVSRFLSFLGGMNHGTDRWGP